MEFRQLVGSGFKVRGLSLGTDTFGRGNEFFKSWGSTKPKLRGLTMFDSANVYSNGMVGKILGQAIKDPRTRCTFRPKAPSARDQARTIFVRHALI